MVIDIGGSGLATGTELIALGIHRCLHAADNAACKGGVAGHFDGKAIIPGLDAGLLDHTAIGTVDVALCDSDVGTGCGAEGGAAADLSLTCLVAAAVLQAFNGKCTAASHANLGGRHRCPFDRGVGVGLQDYLLTTGDVSVAKALVLAIRTASPATTRDVHPNPAFAVQDDADTIACTAVAARLGVGIACGLQIQRALSDQFDLLTCNPAALYGDVTRREITWADIALGEVGLGGIALCGIALGGIALYSDALGSICCRLRRRTLCRDGDIATCSYRRCDRLTDANHSAAVALGAAKTHR